MLTDKIFQVKFLGETLVPVSEDETILHASLKAGIPHYHVCGGMEKSLPFDVIHIINRLYLLFEKVTKGCKGK